MSVLVWVMFDGKHQDMIATCRAGDGKWLTLKWDWRQDGGMIGFRHDHPLHADSQVAEWTEEFEANGSWLIADPEELLVNPPDDSWEIEVNRWWSQELRPQVLNMVLWNTHEEECTLDLPTVEDPGQILTVDPYMAKLSWGP